MVTRLARGGGSNSWRHDQTLSQRTIPCLISRETPSVMGASPGLSGAFAYPELRFRISRLQNVPGPRDRKVGEVMIGLAFVYLAVIANLLAIAIHGRCKCGSWRDWWQS